MLKLRHKKLYEFCFEGNRIQRRKKKQADWHEKAIFLLQNPKDKFVVLISELTEAGSKLHETFQGVSVNKMQHEKSHCKKENERKLRKRKTG